MAHAALGRDQRVTVVEAEIAELDLAANLDRSTRCRDSGVGDLRLL